MCLTLNVGQVKETTSLMFGNKGIQSLLQPRGVYSNLGIQFRLKLERFMLAENLLMLKKLILSWKVQRF